MATSPLRRHRVSKAQYGRELPHLRDELLEAQARTRKAETFAVAMIVTGVPAAGRSESINKLLEWLDPKYVTVHAFGAADHEEKQRPAMWRYWSALPTRGRITFYFAGWYSDYMGSAFRSRSGPRHRKRALERIRQLEAMLCADGIRVLKVHLYVDAKTQRQRLARLRADKLTRWRVTHEDRWLARHHGHVARVAARCLKDSNQRVAPWHLIDGADDEYRQLAVGKILLDELRAGLRSRRQAKPALPQAKARAGGLRIAQPSQALDKQEYEHELEALQGRLALLTRRAAFGRRALVLVFEGIDAAGKGGCIRRVTSALDARQYQVVPVSAPTPEELSYPYLWRFWRHVPKRGDIAIFDRSWYGRVLVERVRGLTATPDWQRAYDEIVEFERQLTEHGIVVAKFWLQVSKDEQLRRFKARDENPLKRFKVDPEDWVNRRFFDAYQSAAAEMIRRTNAADAQWTLVAADDKRRARLQVLRTVCEEIERKLRK